MTGLDRVEAFHSHLDVCKRCREQCFNLCPEGVRLINLAAGDLKIHRPPKKRDPEAT